MTPAAAVQARAVELMGSGTLGVATDSTSYPGRLLVGIARPGAVGVLQINTVRWKWLDWVEFAVLIGMPIPTEAPPQPSALERAKTLIARAAGRKEVAHG